MMTATHNQYRVTVRAVSLLCELNDFDSSARWILRGGQMYTVREKQGKYLNWEYRVMAKSIELVRRDKVSPFAEESRRHAHLPAGPRTIGNTKIVSVLCF
jgi:hypothetical protein